MHQCAQTDTPTHSSGEENRHFLLLHFASSVSTSVTCKPTFSSAVNDLIRFSLTIDFFGAKLFVMKTGGCLLTRSNVWSYMKSSRAKLATVNVLSVGDMEETGLKDQFKLENFAKTAKLNNRAKYMASSKFKQLKKRAIECEHVHGTLVYRQAREPK
ncbi:uncharacterized protein LOC141596329 [Silene latifolia]|uniref:uncharacterized protein LOC141596329 n=1 Tax=Silene latifolia TaxID=37657 RepID=UPI003D78457F